MLGCRKKFSAGWVCKETGGSVSAAGILFSEMGLCIKKKKTCLSVIVGGCRLAGGGGGRGWSLAIGDGWWVGVGGLWLTRSGSSHSLKCS